MLGRTIGIDLAIRGEHVAQVFEDGRPLGKPIRFRLSARSLRRFVDTITAGLPEGTSVQAVMEPGLVPGGCLAEPGRCHRDPDQGPARPGAAPLPE